MKSDRGPGEIAAMLVSVSQGGYVLASSESRLKSKSYSET
jgi:hypothetical protein